MPFQSLFTHALSVLFGAWMVSIFVGDLLRRASAGPVRFRLPLASADRVWRMTTQPWIFLIISVFAVLESAQGGGLPLALIAGMLLGTVFVNNRWYSTRPDKERWAGWVAAGGALAGGAMLLALGVWTLTTGFAPLKSTFLKNDGLLYVILMGAVFGLWGGYRVVELFRGTVLRERGVELFGLTHPWKRVSVEGWSPDEGGGFLLRLKILSPKLFALKVYADSAAVVPVAAADRPDVESFLARCGATTPAPTAVES
jgi:hypothetical protein